jgi:diaminopimelate epimerase
VFVDDADKVPLYTLGPALEKDRSIFPQGTNVGFVQVLPSNKINYWYVELWCVCVCVCCGLPYRDRVC